MTTEQSEILDALIENAKQELYGVAEKLSAAHADKLREYAKLAGDVALAVVSGEISLAQAQHNLTLLAKSGRNEALVAAREGEKATAAAATRWLEFAVTQAAKLLLA